MKQVRRTTSTEQREPHAVTSALPMDDFVIRVEFDNGEMRDYDLKEWQLGQSVMSQSMGERRFRTLSADRFGRAVVWDDKTDIAAYELYRHGVIVDVAERDL